MVFTLGFGMSSSSSSWPAKKASRRTFLVISLAEAWALLLVVREEGVGMNLRPRSRASTAAFGTF